MKSGGIFISYRRGVSGSIVDRINDYLVHLFGTDAVFMDIDSVGYGAEFPEAIRTSLDKSGTVLAIIGPEWMNPREAGGPRGPSKWVQMEIEKALERRHQGMVVIPVLVGDASLPSEDELPPSLKLLPMLNAAEVRQGKDFRNDMERLVGRLPAATRRLQLKSAAGKRTGILIGAGVVAIAGLSAAFMWPKLEPAAAPVETASIETQSNAPAAGPAIETVSTPSMDPVPAQTQTAEPQSPPASLQPPPASTEPRTAPQAAAPPVVAPTPSRPRLSANVSNAFVSATQHHDTNTMSSLKFQLSVTNNSDSDVSVVLYTYRDKQMSFSFSGGGNIRPTMYSTLSFNTCSESRPVRCRMGKSYMPIGKGETITVPIEIRGSIAAPFDQRSKLIGGTLNFTLLVDAGGDEDASLLVTAPATVDASNY